MGVSEMPPLLLGCLMDLNLTEAETSVKLLVSGVG